VIHDAELFTVGVDEVVVTFRTDDERAVTTAVGGHRTTTRGPYHHATVRRLEGDTEYALTVDGAPASDLLPSTIRTLPEPGGRRLATFTTVNDVHFGELECGKLGTAEEVGPIFVAAPGEDPYPETMNRAVIDEMAAISPDIVLVKGDLTNLGTEEEYQAFLDAYGQLGERMHHVRGNHDAMISHKIASEHAPFVIELEGAALAVLDTVRPGHENGRIPADQLAWLEELARESPTPVLVFGHHHPWDPASRERKPTYFGINPDDSDALCAVIDQCESIAGYFAGHTHRTRVRRFPTAREVPIVEIACVKDYPGAWAEYRVYEGGYVQLTRRASAPAAMSWTERTRNMFAGLYRDYALGSLADRCFVQPF
jgi:predicted phosphodiesterase